MTAVIAEHYYTREHIIIILNYTRNYHDKNADIFEGLVNFFFV